MVTIGDRWALYKDQVAEYPAGRSGTVSRRRFNDVSLMECYSNQPRDGLRRRMHIGFLRAVVLVALATELLIGCAGGGVTYDASDLPEQLVARSAEYLVGPGDSLNIFVWDQPELSTSVQVRPDGRISTPLVEDLEAAGRSPTELARTIESVLAEYVRAPVVTVIVESFVGDTEQLVRVVGQAAEPRALQFRDGMTVLDVMIEVGGLSESASGNRATLIRQSGAEQVQIRVRLDDLLNDGDIEQNIRILPGDVLVIPETIF